MRSKNGKIAPSFSTYITKPPFGNLRGTKLQRKIYWSSTHSAAFQTYSGASGIAAAQLLSPADDTGSRVFALRGARPGLVPDVGHPPSALEVRPAGVALGRPRGCSVEGELGAGEHHDAFCVVCLLRGVALGRRRNQLEGKRWQIWAIFGVRTNLWSIFKLTP